MPIERVKDTAKKTTSRIRHHWSHEEKLRRQQMASVMQMQLLTALGFKPAPAVKK